MEKFPLTQIDQEKKSKKKNWKKKLIDIESKKKERKKEFHRGMKRFLSKFRKQFTQQHIWNVGPKQMLSEKQL